MPRPGSKVVRGAASGALGLLAVAGLWALAARMEYGLFHTVVEVFGVVVSAAVFIVAWHGRRFGLDTFFLIVGAACGAAAVLKVPHLLAEGGLRAHPGWGLNQALQLALVARLVQSLSFPIACRAIGRDARRELVLAAYGSVTALALLAILGFGAFPTCMRGDGTPTAFLLASNPVVFLALGAAVLCLVRRRRQFEPGVFWTLLGSIVLTVLDTLCFSWTSGPAGPLMKLGNVLEVGSYLLLYRCVVVTGLVSPHRLLLGDLRAQETELREHREHLEDLVRARTEELRTANERLRREVADRRLAQETLRQSEERFRALVEHGSDVILVLDSAATITYASPSVSSVAGYAPEELVGHGALRYVHPEDVSQVVEVLTPLLRRTGVSAPTEFRIRRRDGSWGWFEGVATNPGGADAIRGVVVNLHDVTERRRHEQQLRAMSARNEALLAAIPDIIMEVDANKTYTWANPAGLAFFGDDCIGQEASHYFEGEQDTYRIVQPLFGGTNDDVIYVESWQRRRDGETRLLAWWCRALTDAEGNVTGALSTARDITEARQAEKALAESETRYRNLVEASADWVWEVDANAVYTYASPRVKEILGYEPEEIVGKTPFDLMPPGEAERVKAEFAAIAARGEPFRHLPNRNVCSDGRLIEVETNGIPILDASGAVRGYRGMDRDVTGQRRAEDRQARLVAGLRSVVEAADELVLIDSVDTLYRRAVELAREKLGLERCSIFVADGDDLRGTYGTDIEGNTTDEREVLIAGHPADKWSLRLVQPGMPRWFVEEADRTTHDGKGMAHVGPGWIAWTPIQTATRPLGVLFNDSAISGAPLDEARQDVAAAYCSMLAALIEKKRAEEELRSGEEQLRTAWDMASIGKVLTAPDGRLLRVNRAFCDMLGRTEAELTGAHMTDITHPDDIEISRAFMAQVTGDPTGRGRLAKRYVRPDGAVVWADVTTTLLRDADGSPRHFVTHVQDTTERKRLERDREALARLNEAILGTMPYIVLIVDADLRVVGTSRDDVEGCDVAAALAEGRSPLITEVFPRALADRVGLEDRLRAAIASRVQDDVLGVYHPASDHPDRRHDDRYMDFQIRPFAAGEGDDAEPQALLCVIDATRRRTMEQHVSQTSKLAAIGTLAGGVAHDFNNILTGVIGYTSILLDNGVDRAQQREYLQQVNDLAQRAAGLTRQLLLFSRKAAPAVTIVDVNSCIDGLAKMLRRLLGEDVELLLDLAADVASVKADPTHIEQITMNLVVNARDALDEGGRITVETANVTLSEDYARVHMGVNAGPHVVIAVSDTGCGMDEATQERIFEPFFTTKEVGRGTGLGLATVYGIVEQHGGHIAVHSEPGRGTTFRVYLPVFAEGASDVAEPKSRLCHDGTETILVVEDERPVLEVIRETLSKRHYNVLCANNPGEAEALFEAHQDKIALLLTDVVMPGMLGPTLYERLAARRPSLRAIYMSGHADRGAPGGSGVPEGAPFLQKPFEPDAIARKVREVLGEPSAVALPS